MINGERLTEKFRASFHRAVSVSALLFCALALLLCVSFAAPQKNKASSSAPAPLLTRTTIRHEARHFGYGSTLTLIGAPQGSITIQGWPQSEIDITADIELHAETEADLSRLATINSFVFDEGLNHMQVLTTGTHDKVFMRRVAKDFPKTLLGLPWKIDYRVRVPVATDLEINAGRGTISVAGVEGAIKLTATESDAKLTLTGGTVAVTIASGKVNLNIPVRSWRGGGADVRLASGDLTIELTGGFNGDIDADLLRMGQIENSYEALAPRERPGLTDRVIRGRAGAGGAYFKFTVGDGTLRIKKTGKDKG
jgi:hypothetical protein